MTNESEPTARCDHAWNETLIETLPDGKGVVCRKCGAEGAVYR